MTLLPLLTKQEKRMIELVSLTLPKNDNRSNLRHAHQQRVDELLAEIQSIKQVGKTDYEQPRPIGRLVVKPSPAWRKMVTLG